MGLLDALKAWSFRKCASKLLKRGIRVVIAGVVAHLSPDYGVTIDQDKMFLGVWALLEGVSNFLKVKLENTKLNFMGKYFL